MYMYKKITLNIKLHVLNININILSGNYYSLRSEHQKAVVYFQRALSLDPQYLSAWILMGHEFIELQNSNAAIQCYRHAIGEFLNILIQIVLTSCDLGNSYVPFLIV